MPGPRQFWVLFVKNWIVLAQHPFLNLLRCFLLPVAYGIFLALAQTFLSKPSNLGLGSPAPIQSFLDHFDGSLKLIWADGTNGTAVPSAADVISHITRGFSSYELDAVKQVEDPNIIPTECPQNFNLFSECYAGIAFTSIPETGDIQYTIWADGGLFYVNVDKHNGDFERRILPLQWAIDTALMDLKSNYQPPTPLEWPFTIATNEEQATDIRLGYVGAIGELLVFAFFVCFVGIVYQLPGSFAGERANGLTPHLKAMGLVDSARIISWHISISLAYLPAWIIVSFIWRYILFHSTNTGIVIAVNLLAGLSFASWAIFVAVPFGKSPQLAAVSATFLAIVLCVVTMVATNLGPGGNFVFSLIFPPGFFVFALRSICGFENSRNGSTSFIDGDPIYDISILPVVIAAVINVFLWPYLAVLLERKLYDPKYPSRRSKWWLCCRRRKSEPTPVLPKGVAISIRGLQKQFTSSLLGFNKHTVTAVSDLTLDIPKYGIFVLLGSNGAGKSTTLSILGGLSNQTGGELIFEEGHTRPPKHKLGIVPQKNVLFPELTCLQTLRVWSAIKGTSASTEEDLEQLLRDCDLEKKIHSNASTLSGGQKRKLQLAIGLVGGSELVLVDECTSGVDPLSRRALWRTLTSFRNERTIVFTTHFLDEADLLADDIAILAAPGKLVANGSPVALKHDLGKGYSIQVTFDSTSQEKDDRADVLLHQIRDYAPTATCSGEAPVIYHLNVKDTDVVEQVLRLLDTSKESYGVSSYDILGTSIEGIFLDLMYQQQRLHDEEKAGINSSASTITPPVVADKHSPLLLTNGRSTSPLQQALTVFHKRCIIARRSWLTPLLMLLVAVLGSTIPTVFLTNRAQTCVTSYDRTYSENLFLPNYPQTLGRITDTGAAPDAYDYRFSPPDVAASLGTVTSRLPIKSLPDNTSFIQDITQHSRNISLGGASFGSDGNVLIAYESSSPGINGAAMLNFASNILYNRALNATRGGNSTASIIRASYSVFPPVKAGTFVALKWVAFFGATMAVYPSFFALYVSRERHASVQAMQMSNGLNNVTGMWLGHLMFDGIFSTIAATIITIVFACMGHQFNGLGLFWFVLVLYGFAGTLFAYCFSLITSSPLAAFAAQAGYNVVIFLLYISAYMLTLTYAKTSEAHRIITTIHFTMSLLTPVTSMIRAAFISVNLFSLLCKGDTPASASSLADLIRYGGPILYLIPYSFVLLGVLVWANSGSLLPRRINMRKKLVSAGSADSSQPSRLDVDNETTAVSSSNDLLRVLNISKTYNGRKVVDELSLGVARDTTFAMLGPNGAGKTTTFNVIRGDIIPEEGDVIIDGSSIVHHPKQARLGLGVCPQFTAIDSQLTVREHLMIYGRLKGLNRKRELHQNIESLMKATALFEYADRLASKLSGGNQRKLALAIALIGNPSVILIDEFSTGIDAKTKREMWGTLRAVATGKAVVITTHSMEEASALANKVGIIAKRLLAVGTTESLSARYANYEVHFSCRTPAEVQRAQIFMSSIPGARMAEDVATRFEVPINNSNGGEGGGMTLSKLFHMLSHGSSESSLARPAEEQHARDSGISIPKQDLDNWEFTVEKATLESVFLKVIRENEIQEEDMAQKRWWKRF